MNACRAVRSALERGLGSLADKIHGDVTIIERNSPGHRIICSAGVCVLNVAPGGFIKRQRNQSANLGLCSEGICSVGHRGVAVTVGEVLLELPVLVRYDRNEHRPYSVEIGVGTDAENVASDTGDGGLESGAVVLDADVAAVPITYINGSGSTAQFSKLVITIIIGMIICVRCLAEGNIDVYADLYVVTEKCTGFSFKSVPPRYVAKVTKVSDFIISC